MDDQDTTFEIVASIYDAALDSKVWPKALKGLTELLESSAATLLFGDAMSPGATVFESIGVDADCLRLYDGHFDQPDGRSSMALGRPGTMAANDLAGSKLFRGQLYNAFLAPADLPHVIGSVLLTDKHAFSTIRIHRSRRRGPFGDRAKLLYATFVPHLRRAFAIHQRLHQARMHASAYAQALDRVALGVILLDRRGEALLINRSAREILDQNDGLALRRDRLHAARPELTRELDNLIRNASGMDGCHPPTGGALAFSRPSLQRPLSILVVTVRLPAKAFLFSGSLVLVFVSDPERGAESAPEILQRLYGLTTAESRLAALLLEGKTVDEAAGALEIARLTARTQLKRVFRKTDVNRQSDLIRLFMRGLGQLRGPETSC